MHASTHDGEDDARPSVRNNCTVMSRSTLLRVVAVAWVLFGGLASASAQRAPVPTVTVAPAGPSLNLPVCVELPFDPAAYVQDLQVALAYHRAEVNARSDASDASPAALAVSVEARCARRATEVVLHIAHLETGRSVSGRVQLEGDDLVQRGRWLARATARLLQQRWADLSGHDHFPRGNPYRIARYDAFPDNPYRGPGDFTPERNPYLFEERSLHPPPAPSGEDLDLAPENPYRG